MTDTLTDARIAELVATTRVCKWSDLFDAKAEVVPPADVATVIDAYLEPFAAYVKGCKCLNCETPQQGFMGAIFGGFTWGIAHGEGFCETCGWPGRAYHEIPDPEGGERLAKFSLVLQYHPQFVQQNRKAKAA